MTEHFLTLETFTEGITNYIAKHLYSNVENEDLWKALTEAAWKYNRIPADVTVKDIMTSWVSQAGFPLLSVDQSDANFIRLGQEQFHHSSSTGALPTNTTWFVPVSIAYPMSARADFSNTVPKYWMTTSGLNIDLEERPFIINVQQTGYYRVNYDPQNWKDLAKVLKEDHLRIHKLNRAQLLDDSFQLARTKHLSYETALDISQYLSSEEEIVPWKAALKSFEYIEKMIKGNATALDYINFKNYMFRLITPLYNGLGFEVSKTDLHLTLLKRTMVLTWLCQLDHPECIEKSQQMFGGWMRNSSINPIDANLREVVYATAVQHGGEEEHGFVLQQFKAETVSIEKERMKAAILASGSEELIQRFWNETGAEKTPDRSKTAKEIIEIARNDLWWINNKMEKVTDWIQKHVE
jgi:aminopeptidase N